MIVLRSLPTTIPNPHNTNHNNNYCLLPAVASTTSENSTQQVQPQTNKRNYKPVAEGQNSRQKFRSLLALQGSGKNLCGQKPSGIKRPQREKPKLKSATYCTTNTVYEMKCQFKLNDLQCTAHIHTSMMTYIYGETRHWHQL